VGVTQGVGVPGVGVGVGVGVLGVPHPGSGAPSRVQKQSPTSGARQPGKQSVWNSMTTNSPGSTQALGQTTSSEL
jgi:hypothetical protein